MPASIPLIGCGGITTGRDALEFAEAGATLVQVYTAFGYDGVGFPRRIKDQLQYELAGRTWAGVSRAGVEKFSAQPLHIDEAEDLLKREGQDLLGHVEELEKVLAELDGNIVSAQSELERKSEESHPMTTPSDVVEKGDEAPQMVAHSEAEPALLDHIKGDSHTPSPSAEEIIVALASVTPAEHAIESQAEIATTNGDVKTN